MDVLKKLRIKMIVSIIAVQMIVLAALFLLLDVSVTKTVNDKAFGFLTQLSQNGGHLPRPKNFQPFSGPGFERRDQAPFQENRDGVPSDRLDPPSEALSVNREGVAGPFNRQSSSSGVASFLKWIRIESYDFRNYFAVLVSPDRTSTQIIHDFPLNYTDHEIQEIVKKILSENRKKGSADGLSYLISDQGADTLVCVMDRSSELSTLYQFYEFTGAFYGVSLLAAFFLSWLLAGWAVKPVAAAFAKQKQFIADAGHELKTPIAVIGANIDVLMSDIPDNKWLAYIRTENERMGHLVKDLLYLAKTDADRQVFHFSQFDFTAAVNSAVLPFESVIFEQQKELELDIAESMRFFGDEQQIKQAIIILVDNAIKNSDPGAVIKVSAHTDQQKVTLSVYNTGHGIPPDDLEKIFLRFYRSDASRARQTGGYGLGLAIAKSIAESHHGHLSAASEYGSWAEFTLMLPVQ
jgi:signal transduction histidine kinase